MGVICMYLEGKAITRLNSGIVISSKKDLSSNSCWDLSA